MVTPPRTWLKEQGNMLRSYCREASSLSSRGSRSNSETWTLLLRLSSSPQTAGSKVNVWVYTQNIGTTSESWRSLTCRNFDNRSTPSLLSLNKRHTAAPLVNASRPERIVSQPLTSAALQRHRGCVVEGGTALPGRVVTQFVGSVLRVVVGHKLLIRADPRPGVLRGCS